MTWVNNDVYIVILNPTVLVVEHVVKQMNKASRITQMDKPLGNPYISMLFAVFPNASEAVLLYHRIHILWVDLHRPALYSVEKGSIQDVNMRR